MNNRKQKEKENNDDNNKINIIQPIQPKFIPNWSTVIRFDRIVVNVSDCVYDVLPKVCKDLKFKCIKDPNNAEWDLWWTDWHVLPQTLMKMEHHQKINHFPGMHVLSRKNLMAKNLMKMRKKSTQQYNFFPLTWNLPLDYNQFKAYYQTKPKGKARTYIIKPQSMSQGKGIFLTRKLQDIDPRQHCVIQRYISKPYLIDGLKFDLRIYVLVASVDPLQVYIYKEGLARFATEQYIVPNKDNMEDICMHLTNYAINKDSEKFVFNEDQNDMSKGHKRSLTSAFATLQKNGVNVTELQNKIHQIIVKTLISGLSHLRFQYRSSQSQNYRSDMCFQILGFDIILNQNADPLLLQINYTPSFSTDTPLDLNIKRNIIKDTMILMQLTKQIKQKTVKQRVQFKNQRMMTGKKNKLTLEQKQIKKVQVIKQKLKYTNDNLGGYTRIYPLDQNEQLQITYDQLIRLQSQVSNQTIKKPKKQPNTTLNIQSTPLQQTKGRNSQKLSRLPNISLSKQNHITTSKQNPAPIRKYSANKIQSQKRINSLARSSPMSDIIVTVDDSTLKTKDHIFMMEQKEAALQENSEKFIKKMKLREIYPKKKIQVRETLVPKAIQFEGQKFDGLSEAYKLGFMGKE